MKKTIDGILARFNEEGVNILDLLHAYGSADDAELWKEDSRLYCGFSRKLLAAGHPTRAFDLCAKGWRFTKATSS